MRSRSVIARITSEFFRRRPHIKPFNDYTNDGNQQLGELPEKGKKSRADYCLELVMKYGAEPRCAYCGLYLLEPYENWLHLSVDHVVRKKLIDHGWREDCIKDRANCVICCRACNEFVQQKPDEEQLQNMGLLNPPENWEAFVKARNKIFLIKRDHALDRHRKERAVWDKKWRHKFFEKEPLE